jgi:ribosome maturation protein SDO1
VNIEDAVVARFKKGGRFEILVDPEGALSLRKGEDVCVEDVLVVDTIFEDASKGTRSSERDLMNAFGTVDVLEIAGEIVSRGELHLTTKQRRKMQEEKKERVIDTIARNAINPQTNAPHPPLRIARAMDEAGVHIDISKSIDELVRETVRSIRAILPIHFEELEIAVKIPVEYAAKSYGEISEFGELVKEEWQGSFYFAAMRIPAGMQDRFYSFINRIAKGEAEIKLLK